MAEPWIKIRHVLASSPKVIGIADALKVEVCTALGATIMLLILADTHTVNGQLDHFSFARVDEMLRVPGYCAAAESVGLLRKTDTGIALLDFKKHNGSSAKKRALAQLRQARTRTSPASRFCHARSVTKTSPEQEQAESRLDKSKQAGLPDFALEGDACSLLARVLGPKGADAVMRTPGVDTCQVEWAADRLRAELEAARRKTRTPIKNVAGYFRDLVVRERCPDSWRDEWNRKRLAGQAAKIGDAS